MCERSVRKIGPRFRYSILRRKTCQNRVNKHNQSKDSYPYGLTIQAQQSSIERPSTVLTNHTSHFLRHLPNNNTVDIYRIKERAHQSSLYPQHVPPCDLVAASHGQHGGCIGSAGFGAEYTEARIVVSASRWCVWSKDWPGIGILQGCNCGILE